MAIYRVSFCYSVEEAVSARNGKEALRKAKDLLPKEINGAMFDNVKISKVPEEDDILDYEGVDCDDEDEEFSAFDDCDRTEYFEEELA